MLCGGRDVTSGCSNVDVTGFFRLLCTSSDAWISIFTCSFVCGFSGFGEGGGEGGGGGALEQ